MDISPDKLRELSRRITIARMKLLCENGFYGLLLMHVGFALTDQVECAYQDGKTIYFNPECLDRVSDEALEYMMMHEILHIALRHSRRGAGLDPERFNIACDIVVNSNILKSSDMDPKSVTFPELGGVQLHTAPNGREGYEFTAEELYELVPEPNGDTIKGPGSSEMSDPSGAPADDDDADNEQGGTTKGDPSWEDGRAQKYRIDAGSGGGWDDHITGGETEEDEALRDVWVKRITDAAEAISIRDPSNSRGLLPAFAERMLKALHSPQTDWRTILNDFVQEEISDYSFTPPDRRFDDSPFFLPDFNEKDDKVEKILFMIDTSGSMSDEMIGAAYSEIKGAIDQFNGHLEGWLGFFDAAVIEPQPFADEYEFKSIRAAGGGGTDFQIIFEYVAEHMSDDPPVSIIILTDGYAPFPDEKLSCGIPVLWLINNEEVTPPWGKIARIKV